MMNESSNNLQYALQYLEMGFSVIPIGKDKKPLVLWKEFQLKKASNQQVEKWFLDFPQANIGIVTGAISGVVVIDVEKGGKIDDFPKTVTSQTGGDGWHFFYKYNPDKPIKNYGRIRDLTDIRGEGGYVVVPPSSHQSGKNYIWLTQLDRTILNDFPYWILEKPLNESSLSSQSSVLKTVEVLQGSRNKEATSMAGKLLYDLSPELWESAGWPEFRHWNREVCKPPLEEPELRSIWESIKKAERKNSRNKFEKDKKIIFEIYSKRLKDGRIIEAFYDPEKEETGLLTFEEGKISKVMQFSSNNQIYSAPPAANKLIISGFVKLPSDAVPFGSEVSLLEEIKTFIHEFVQIPEQFEEIASFYVLFSWVYDEFQELPYLRAIGDFGTGKSRFLKVMGALCYRSIFLNGAASVSAIFRIINDIKGTIILDEADFHSSDTSNDIIKILNSGFQKGIPVFRSEAKGGNNKSFDPIPYDVYCPKVIATRKNFTDEALESRCLNNAMETFTRDIAVNLDDTFEAKALKIRNKLVYFRFNKLKEGLSKVSLPKMQIEPRLKQIISPIYCAISDEKGKQMILKFIQKKQHEVFENRFNSFEGELLQAFLMVRELDKEPTMKQIAEKFNNAFAGSYTIKAKRVGTVFDQIFHLAKKKSSKGIYVLDNEENDVRIKALKIKFGIEKTEMNIMNDVNLPQDKPQITAKDIQNIFDEKIIKNDKTRIQENLLQNNESSTISQKEDSGHDTKSP